MPSFPVAGNAAFHDRRAVHHPGIVDTAMPASIRAQQAAVIGQETLTRFHDLHDKGAMQAPERPVRVIAAVIEANDPARQGRIFDIGSPEGQQLLECYTG